MVELDGRCLETPLPPMESAPRRGRWATVAMTVTGFALLAVGVVVHSSGGGGASVVLKQDSSAELFKSAFASQQADLAKHRAAEAKAKAQARKQAMGGVSRSTSGGGSSSSEKGMSDAALFKQALSDQDKELAKTRAKRAQLAKAVSQVTGTANGAPRSKAEQISDAKLFQDAIKEQHDEQDKDKATLKQGLVAAIKKSRKAVEMSKAAQDAKVHSELNYILGAASSSAKHHAAASAATVVKAVKKAGASAKGTSEEEGPSKSTQGASVGKGRRGRSATASSSSADHDHAARMRELERLQHAAMSGHRPRKASPPPKPVAKPVKKAVPMLSRSGEEKLYKLLDSGDSSGEGAHAAAVRIAAAKEKVAKKLRAAHEAAKAAPSSSSHGREHAEAAVTAKKVRIRVGGHHAQGVNWAKDAFAKADSSVKGRHTAKGYENEAIARSDALEAELVKGAR